MARSIGGVKYCPRCGSILYPRVRDGRKELFCRRCGYTEPLDGGEAEVYKIRSTVRHTPKERMIIVDSSQVPPTASLLKGQITCPKCGHDEIYYWMMQTRAADEPPTRFYRCKRCGYTWREYA
ncbi:MAG: transcription factor S [Desulfurococcales archaeon]|nr:transcription factor S [Desulfurococcales archaeon]